LGWGFCTSQPPQLLPPISHVYTRVLSPSSMQHRTEQMLTWENGLLESWLQLFSSFLYSHVYIFLYLDFLLEKGKSESMCTTVERKRCKSVLQQIFFRQKQRKNEISRGWGGLEYMEFCMRYYGKKMRLFEQIYYLWHRQNKFLPNKYTFQANLCPLQVKITIVFTLLPSFWNSPHVECLHVLSATELNPCYG
jgi:hypothetical protein